MKVVCIMQSRMGSTRLPGKILKKICGKTVLEHDIYRLKKIEQIDEIVIATTIEEKDDVVEEEAKRLKVSCFRGSEDDVLDRYYNAAKDNNADVVVRVTSDCPLIDSFVSGQIIQYYLDNIEKYDYVSNTIDRTYPRGLDTEVFSFKALEKAYSEAKIQRDREHVTPYIWDNSDMFRIFQYKGDGDYSDYRWTLDTEEDFILINKIYEQLYRERYFGMQEILDLYSKDKSLININSKIKQKEI